jgi:branched-subunit amino acid aminotransferase/4-amino-4-deoxychorismate lyase
VKKENISLADLDKYDEFFITSTSMNVMPISQIDDKKYPVAKTREIIGLFKDYCRNKELRKQLS